ncbi:hypothetical protein HAX54_027026 [Datura stramonium]|uniref:Uncharacterized protein n=1 Tax=Datura stramonium TaxID=4076 RepID=A0ABS8V4P1_DATST|nr:hypothetical protein [Datura stramonium]
MARTVNGAAYNMPKKCGGVCGRRRRHERKEKGKGLVSMALASEKKGKMTVREDETAVVVYEERRVRGPVVVFRRREIKREVWRRFGVGGREREVLCRTAFVRIAWPIPTFLVRDVRPCMVIQLCEEELSILICPARRGLAALTCLYNTNLCFNF